MIMYIYICICNYWPGDIPAFKLGFLASNAIFPSPFPILWPEMPVISQ